MKNQEYTQEEYQAAKKAVDQKVKFYIHLTVYIVVNGGLHLVNYIEGAPYWAIWPLLGWGIGIFFQAVKTFSFFSNEAWKQKQIQKELEKRD